MSTFPLMHSWRRDLKLQEQFYTTGVELRTAKKHVTNFQRINHLSSN